jgi:hypothetical protein
MGGTIAKAVFGSGAKAVNDKVDDMLTWGDNASSRTSSQRRGPYATVNEDASIVDRIGHTAEATAASAYETAGTLYYGKSVDRSHRVAEEVRGRYYGARPSRSDIKRMKEEAKWSEGEKIEGWADVDGRHLPQAQPKREKTRNKSKSEMEKARKERMERSRKITNDMRTKYSHV